MITLVLLCTLPVHIGLGQDVIPTKGKEFWVGFMENYNPNFEESLDLFITSDQNTSGTVSIPLQGWTFDFSVTANVTTTVTVPNNLAEHLNENQIISQKGVLVETQDTVSVFAINYDPFTADGTKVLPTKALGTKYRVSSYTGLQGVGSELVVVATEDDTEVEITPSVTTDQGNAAGVPFLVQLDRGESYQIIQESTNDDLTGTTVIGTEASGQCRPFAVFSGVSCSNVPVGCLWCDHMFEQNFSTDTWGTEYYIVPYEFASGYTYRVLADTDGTQVTINGGTPINIDAGQYFEDNSVVPATCVTSSAPISVVQYMQGQDCTVTGDPAMLILNDASQKINNVTFSTVVSAQIVNHGINVIIETGDIGSFSVDGAAIAASEFTQFPSCPSHSYAQLTITEGSHTLDAPNGFTAYAFGLGDAESYSYSVGSFSPNPFGDIDIQEAFCSSDQVVLGVEDPGFDTFWYNYDFPEDTLGTDQTLVLEPPIVSGVYVASYNTLLSGCEAEEYFSVEVPNPPDLSSLTMDQTICQYESVQLNVSPEPANSFYQYSWSPQLGLSNSSIPNPIATPLNTTEYTVTVTSPTGCASASNDVLITVEGGTLSNLTATADDYELCIGESTQLLAQIDQVFFEENFDPGISWGLWSDISNGSESDVCGSIVGNSLYFNGTGSREATTIPVDVSNGGTIGFALIFGEDVFPCDNVDVGEDVILEYSLDGVVWNPIQTIFAFAQTGWEQFEIAIPMAAQSANTQFKWRQLSNSGADQDNWSMDNIFISTLSSNSLSFDWYTADGVIATNNANPTVSPLQDVTYYVEIEDGNNGCLYTDSLFISVGQNFTLDITPDTILCDIQGIDLEVIPSTNDSFTYSWLPDDGTLSSAFSPTPTASPVTTTTYTVEVSSDQGCVNDADVTITVNQLLDLTVTADDMEICFGESTSLHASVAGDPSGIEYEWSPGLTLSDFEDSDPLATPGATTLYEVIATDTNSGCFLSDGVEVEVNGNFSIDAGEDITVCDASGLELFAEPSIPGSYQWAWSPVTEVTNSNTPLTNLINNESNEFTVTATEDGCTQTDVINVIVIFENFDLGPDIEICLGESAELSTGFPDFDHDWNTGDISETISVVSEQQYSVTVTSDLGCDITDDIFVSVNPLPVVDLGPDNDLCDGESMNLNAENGGSDYEWNTTEVTQLITVSESDIYSVQVTDANGCVNSDDVEITFHELPLAILPTDTTICEDQVLILDAGNVGSSYLWSPNLEDSQFVSVNQADDYEVEITNPEGCSIIDQTVLAVATYPALDLGSDIFACEEDLVVLHSGADETLNVNWSTEETTASINPSESGIYSVVVDNDYCFSTDQLTLYFNPLPQNNLPENIQTCFITNVEDIVLDAGNFGSVFEWNNGSNDQLLNVSEPGVFQVIVTTPFGCESSFSTEVDELCYGEYLYVPSSFTPNNDGDNDAWKAEGIFVADFHVQIYNRWGEVIYESTDINEYWKGNDQGGDHYVEPGVYSYRIRFKYFVNEFGVISDWTERMGMITLVR